MRSDWDGTFALLSEAFLKEFSDNAWICGPFRGFHDLADEELHGIHLSRLVICDGSGMRHDGCIDCSGERVAVGDWLDVHVLEEVVRICPGDDHLFEDVCRSRGVDAVSEEQREEFREMFRRHVDVRECDASIIEDASEF